MSLAVVDASVLTVFYATDDPRRGAVVDRLASGDLLLAPAHLDVEVASALRGLARADASVERVAASALDHLAGLAVRRSAVAPLLSRVWELRHNVTPYDAAYVALAERADAPLLTCDVRLVSASGPRCRFELLA